ncbi:sensory box protein, partial [Vibrio parahaemolyticus V-223/04]
SALSNNRFLN